MRIARVLVAAIGMVGCAGTGVHQSRADGIGVMGQEGATLRARADSARWPWTAADAEFMSTMIHHHAQAIVMAKWAPTHGADPAIQRLAGRIIIAQSDEINLMQTWLRDRGQPVPEPNPAGHVMQMGGMTHTMLMPGMLTEAQMKELDAARGADFDRLFLHHMIQHHRGAVIMVEQLHANRANAQDETVFKFSNDVHVDQTTEVNRMITMMLEMGFVPPPPPST
jgi:uncharacterized protein (DUF305 family)